MSEIEYSKAATEKLSSPDQLDQLMRVTSPKGWLAVSALALVLAAAVVWMMFGRLPSTVDGQAILMRKGNVRLVSAQQAGMLIEFLVSYGETVKGGQVVARIQPDTTPPSSNLVDVKSLYPGVVVKKRAREGDFVATGATLLVLEPIDPTLEVVVFMPLMQAKAVRPGMTVEISPSTTPREVFGFLWGKVERVAEFPSEDTSMLDTLGNEELVKYFLNGGSTSQVVPLEIRVSLVADSSTPSGYAWSSGYGPSFKLRSETLSIATFVLDRQRPISLLVPDAGP